MITIIALCWNHLDDITKPFVKSFLANTPSSADYELILVNNGSKDKTAEYLASIKNSKIKVIQLEKNIGFTAGNNRAWAERNPKSTHTLFINNDIVFHNPKWFEILNRNIKYKTLIGQHLVTSNSATEFRNVNTPYINGWCVLIDNEFLKKHGVFDPDFHMAYFEDVELSARAVYFGYKLKQVDLGIEHLGSKSSDQIETGDLAKYNKFIFRNKLYEFEKGKKLRIVFMCTSNYPFIDSDYEGKGVGGAEASIILLARELAKMGHVVDIYNNSKIQGNYRGVNYINVSQFSYNDRSDIFVLFRNSMAGFELVNSAVRIFWSCDQATTLDWEAEIIPYADMTIAISEYHKNYLVNRYPFNPQNIKVLDLGIKGSDYKEVPDKEGNKLIFCSVPKRGLEFLAVMFPKIKEVVPDAELVITSDYRLWGVDEFNSEFREQFINMPGVRFLGKVQREELVKEQLEAKVMAYPCNYDENFCISAMECIASGAVPVTTPIGALLTTVGDSGILIQGDPSTLTFKEVFINKVCHLLKHEDERIELQNKGRERALNKYTWEYLAKEQWIKLFNEMLKKSGRKQNYCESCNKQFDSAFEFFKHRSEAHVIRASQQVDRQELLVRIRVNRRVELNHSGVSYDTRDEMFVPQRSSGDIVRILSEAYGRDVIVDVKTIMDIDK